MTKTPEEELEEIMSRVLIGGMWQPGNLGLTYIRTGEREMQLATQENNPMAAQARIRMRLLAESTGWKVDESETQLKDISHLSPQEAHMKELMERQEMAQNWKCQCGTPLSAFPLEDGKWVHDGQAEMRLPTGIVEMVEQWNVLIDCPVCELRVPLEPYDYGLLAGDEAMGSFTTENGVTYTALTRPEIIERIDSEAAGEFDLNSLLMVLGTFCPRYGDLLPPHVRGSVVLKTERGEEE